MMHSILEYGVVIWHPYLFNDILRIERVQNKFLAFAAFKLNIPISSHDYALIF